MATDKAAQAQATATAGKPPQAGLVLTTLILGAVITNINLSIANVALPAIGVQLQATEPQLNVVASGFTLGPAATRAQETEAAAGAITALDGNDAHATTGVTGVPSHGHGGGGAVRARRASGSESVAWEYERLDGDGRSAAQS